MPRLIFSWLIRCLALIGLFSLFHLGRFIQKEIRLYQVYKNCQHLKYGMSIDSVYSILGKHIIPEPEIEMSYDSTKYSHYLRYPEQFINEHYLSIQLDTTEKIVIGVLGCND